MDMFYPLVLTLPCLSTCCVASFKWDTATAPRASLYENKSRVNTSTSSSATKSYNYRAYNYNSDSENAAAGNEAVACPQSVALATAFKKRSLGRWEEAKKLRADPILPEFERLALEIAKQRQTESSAIAAAAFTSIGSARDVGAGAGSAPTVDVFRQRSKQSWQKQREQLRSQAVDIELENAKNDRHSTTADSGEAPSSRSKESLAVQLHRRGYGLDSSSTSSPQKTEEKVVQGSAATATSSAFPAATAFTSFRDASRGVWQAAKALRSELPSDVFASSGASVLV